MDGVAKKRAALVPKNQAVRNRVKDRMRVERLLDGSYARQGGEDDHMVAMDESAFERRLRGESR